MSRAHWSGSSCGTVPQYKQNQKVLIHFDADGTYAIQDQCDTQSVLQLHVRGDEKVPGHGVGLAVVSELVTAHRGELKIERSAALGGAMVDITLRAA